MSDTYFENEFDGVYAGLNQKDDDMWADFDEEEERESKYYRANCCPNGHGFDGQCGYLKQYHGPNGECPKDDDQADKYHQLWLAGQSTVTDFADAPLPFPTEAKPVHHITIHIKVFSTKDDIDTELTEIENHIEKLLLSQSKENGFLSFDIWSVDNIC